MAFCIIMGTQDFTSQLKGYEGQIAQCHNCGNWAAHPISSWEWFTVCWIPVIPLGGKHKDLACNICRFRQDIRNRQDVQPGQGQGGGGQPQYPMNPQQQYPPQGWNSGPPPGQGQQPHYK